MSLSRWIIVSNRLPVSWNPQKKQLTKSSGGLVTAIESIKSKTEKVWVGVAPDGMDRKTWNEVYRKTGGTELHPIFLDEELYNDYYNGFCNDLIWPLFHYETDKTKFSEESWQSYLKVNKVFASEILKVAQATDLVWVHDFHLFQVPELIKTRKPKLKTGFFLHIPFPSSEVFRQIPHRREILKGVLEADLVGFHDYSYLRHFCSTVLRVLGIDSSYLSIPRDKGTTDLGVFPVSIDTAKIHKEAKSEKTLSELKEIRSNKKTFLGIDRLDYTKGLELKLKAYREFLRHYPEWHEKVRLIQIAVPSRTEVKEYKELKAEIDGLVGEINGEFSTPKWTPIRYIFSSVGKNHLLALYRSSDALLVTSKRDGMNLVALEYIASQSPQNPGAVILSEFTGAMSMLSETVAINPWNPRVVAEKMNLALNMPVAERRQRWQLMYSYLLGYSATDWADSFMQKLAQVSTRHKSPAEKITPKGLLKKLKCRPKELTLMLDYDGTLVPIEERPEDAVLPSETFKCLKKLIDQGTQITVVSGRPKSFLEKQFGELDVTLACEHGGHVRYEGETRWRNYVGSRRPQWYKTALEIMNDYAKKVPNSFVEKKSFAIAWHYRLSPGEYGNYLARKLLEELETTFATAPASLLSGKKVIEVRAVQANKGFFAQEYLREKAIKENVLAIGDDATDEDLFEAVKGFGQSVKVGGGATKADGSFETQQEVVELLQLLRNG